MRPTRLNLVRFGLLSLLLGFTGCPVLFPILSISPTAFHFDADQREGILILSNAGGGILSWSVESKPDWLAVSPTGKILATGSEVVTFTASFDGLAPGDYRDTVTFTSNGGARGVAVSANVIAPPTLEVSPTFLDFGGSATTRTFEIRNTGGGLLTWQIFPPLSNWLSINPSSGDTPAGERDTITITIDRSLLSPGTQAGPVLIQLTSNAGSAIVTVQATVQSFFVDPTILEFGAQLNQLPLTIRNTGDEDIHWAIDSINLPVWVSLTPDAMDGTLTPGAEATILVDVDRATTGTGTVTGEIRFTSDGGSETVHLTVQGAEPVLRVVPTTLDFGASKPGDTFTIQNTGTGTLAWTIEEGVLSQETWTPGDLPWLAISGNTTGQTGAGETTTISVQADRTQVAPNPDTPYQGNLRITTADGQQAVVSITMMALPPTLRVLPVNLNFGTTYGRRNLAIWNGGLGIVNWRIDTSGKPPWASVDPVDATGVASGVVAGEETAAVRVFVDRTGLPPADQDYTWTFQVTAQDAGGNALTPVDVTVSMNVARVAAIAIDTGESPDGVPNIDNDGIPFVPLGTTNNQGTFIIHNQGTSPLSWNVDSSALPSWMKSIEPAQGVLEPLREVTVTVHVSREGLAFGNASVTLSIISNDPIHSVAPVRVEMQIPKVVVIGVRPTEVALGLYVVSDSCEIANLGDAGSLLHFQIKSTKPWLYFYPETGTSEGTSSIIKDWQGIDISVDRAQLDSSGATGELVVTAFETDENGQRVVIEDVKEQRITVTVQAAPLSFEAAKGRTRVPSMVRFVMLMRDIAYDALPLPDTLLDTYVQSFAIFEKEVPVELTETNRFLTSGANLRTTVALLLDYSGSMAQAAATVSDLTIAGAPDPLQALYERCVPLLIDDLPDSYSIALMEFHDRSQPTRIVAPDGGPNFTTDKTLLSNRLSGIAIRDHGATELLPAVVEAAGLMDERDTSEFRRSFDDADVRALISITDGRLTTPPGRIKDTIDFLAGLRVRFLPIGWGQGVLHEPLARIASGTGGHYYPTAMERTGRVDENGNAITLPMVGELLGWCATEDPAANPCDQSVPKDLRSQVVLSYVTLTEDSPVTVRVDAKFDNPNDDDGVCLPNQGLIAGTFTQKQHDFESISGDIHLGQISLRSEGLQGGRAGAVVRAEYIPRNVDAFEFEFASTQSFTSPVLNPTFLAGWSLTDLGGNKYRLTRGADVAPLPYGAFGDMLYLEFPDPLPAGGAILSFHTTEPVLDPADSQSKYFCYPDTLQVSAKGSFAPAFPTPEVIATAPPNNERDLDFGSTATVSQFTVRNLGGSHDPTGVWLEWTVNKQPDYVTVAPDTGLYTTTTTQDTVTVTLDRSIPSAHYAGMLTLEFTTGSLTIEPYLVDLWVLADVLPPVLAVTSPDFVPGTQTLEFSNTTTDHTVTVANVGQSTLDWTIDSSAFPKWLSVSPAGGSIILGRSTDLTVSVSGLSPGTYTYDFTIQSTGGSTSISVIATIL